MRFSNNGEDCNWEAGEIPPVGAVCDIEFCSHTVYKATITYQG